MHCKIDGMISAVQRANFAQELYLEELLGCEDHEVKLRSLGTTVTAFNTNNQFNLQATLESDLRPMSLMESYKPWIRVAKFVTVVASLSFAAYRWSLFVDRTIQMDAQEAERAIDLIDKCRNVLFGKVLPIAFVAIWSGVAHDIFIRSSWPYFNTVKVKIQSR